MSKRSSKKQKDINELSASIVEQTTSELEETSTEKNPNAVALGRLGGLKGGKARAEKLTAEQRKDIAKKAANMRWGKQKYQ